MLRTALNRLTALIHRHPSALPQARHTPKCTPLQTATRTKCSIGHNIVETSGTGGFDLTFLGTSSQGGARRYPSSLALRLRGATSSQVWLFDVGEGAISQLQRSNMRMGLVRNIFITHLHGDHLFGLPGLVMCILGRRDELTRKLAQLACHAASTTDNALPHLHHSLHVYGPQGIRNYLRTCLGISCFRVPSKNALYIHELTWPQACGPAAQRSRYRSARPYWRSRVRALPFEGPGRDINAELSEDGRCTYRLMSDAAEDTGLEVADRECPANVIAAPVFHTVPTFAYTVAENVAARRFDKRKLDALGIPSDGRDAVRKLFTSWLGGERGVWNGREIDVHEVLQTGRSARRLCVVGDTHDASPAAHIAQGVDVLVHEATNLAAQTELARRRGHSSTLGATAFAKRVKARRLILNHTSVSYSERKIQALENEARGMFGCRRAFVARDLSVFSVPTCEEDGDQFVFQRFAGFADSIEYRAKGGNPFSGDFAVEDEDDRGDGDLDVDLREDGADGRRRAGGAKGGNEVAADEEGAADGESAADEVVEDASGSVRGVS